MNYKRRQFAYEMKDLTQNGEFAGYGAVFNNVDYYNDVIRPGAFQNSLMEWKSKGKLPPVLWQHDTAAPIGPHTLMREDSRGLYTEGQMLISDVQQAREAYALTKSGAISGQSIGYDVPDGGMTYDPKTNTYNLTEIDLWECSLVTFPANPEAMITEVKKIFGAGQLPTLRQFEGMLRDAGCSRKQATDIALGGLVVLLQRDAEADKSKRIDIKSALDATLSAIDKFNPHFGA